MLSAFISITNLQRQLKKVFYSKQPVHIVLSNNQVSGLVFSKEAAEILLQSSVLEQLREELWELNDAETRTLVSHSRRGKTTPLSFNEFAREYGV